MRYRLKDIIILIRTPIGRMQLRESAYQFCWPLFMFLATLYRKTVLRNTCIVAVVGSFGKTTTTYALNAVLGGRISRISYRNSLSFVASALFRIRPKDRHAVIEIGIDRPGQMKRYARMIRPDITVVTSIGSEHHRFFGTLEDIQAEKVEMVRVLSASNIAILNGDDPRVCRMKEQTMARVVTLGTNSANDIYASDIMLDWPHGSRFTLHINGQVRSVSTGLIGKQMIYPALAAVAAAHVQGLNLEHTLSALAELTPAPGRLQPVKLKNGAYILRDDFKSTLETIHVALDVLSAIPAQRKIVVLGDVSELPGSQGPIYRDIGARIAQITSHALLLSSGANFQRYAAGARKAGFSANSFINLNHDILKAIKLLRQYLQPGDVVLIKGRVTQRLGRIALALMGVQMRCTIARCNTSPFDCEYCPMI